MHLEQVPRLDFIIICIRLSYKEGIGVIFFLSVWAPRKEHVVKSFLPPRVGCNPYKTQFMGIWRQHVVLLRWGGRGGVWGFGCAQKVPTALLQ